MIMNVKGLSYQNFEEHFINQNFPDQKKKKEKYTLNHEF